MISPHTHCLHPVLDFTWPLLAAGVGGVQGHGLQHRAQSSGYVRSLNEKPVCIQGWDRVTPREPQLLTRRQGLNLAAGVVGRAMPFSEKVRVWGVDGCIPQAREEAVAALGLREHLGTASGAPVHSWKHTEMWVLGR